MNNIFEEQRYKLIPKAKLSYKIEYTIFLVIALIIVIGIGLFFGISYKIIVPIVVFILLLAAVCIFILAELEYKKYSYNFDEKGVTVVSGVFFRKKEFIPYNTVQDVTIQKGPILRKLSLAEVVIRGINNTIILNDIEKTQAESIKKYILEERSKYNIEY